MRMLSAVLSTLFIATTACAGGVKIAPQELPPGTEYPHPMSIRISPPWDQKGEWILRSPETIGSNHGLLFIDHHVETMPTVTNPSHKLEWTRNPDGTLQYTCRLDNGVRFNMRARAGKNDVSFLIMLTNRFRHDLSNMGTQFCLVQTGVEGFEDSYAQRTYILVDGEFIPMNKTSPGLEDDSKPLFIVTNTKDLPHMPKGDIERSWFAEEQADVPLIANVSDDGKRIVALAFCNGYKIMTNADIPCIHADPMFPDCPVGHQVKLRGKMYFVEGTLDDVLAKFYHDFPEWKPTDQPKSK